MYRVQVNDFRFEGKTEIRISDVQLNVVNGDDTERYFVGRGGPFLQEGG